MKPRIWFVGTGSFAASCLEHMSGRLAFQKIVTGLPTKAGRGLAERVSPVERAAAARALPVERTGPLSKNVCLLEALSSDPPDLVFVVDFAQWIREPFLSAPRFGCLNIHPSLLPRWRGAAPVQRALMQGDAVAGATVFRLTEEMDAGPILAQTELPVPLAATSAEIFETLALTGSRIAVEGVQSLIKEDCRFLPQNSDFATYAPKLRKEEAEVFWAWDCLRVHNIVRAFDSSIGAFALFGGKRLKLWRAFPAECEGSGSPGEILRFAEGDPVVACGSGALRLMGVQTEGKRKMSGSEWACGGRLETGRVIA
jgi:methionyl-tRNA formyltransferase